METVDIRDYLVINKENKSVKKKVTQRSTPEVNYEIVLDTGADVIIRRTTSSGIKRELCIIPSEGLVFIRDVKKKVDKPVTSYRAVTNFFSYIHDFPTFLEQLKNDYYHVRNCDMFTSRILSVTKDGIAKEFLKRGWNPNKFYSNFSREEQYFKKMMEEIPTTFFKIASMIEKVCKKDESMDYLLICALDVADKIDADRAIWMVETIINSNSKYSVYPFQGYNSNEVWGIANVVNKYNLDFGRLITYLTQDLYLQGIDTIDYNIFELYDDTLNLQLSIYDGKIREKYPAHLKECHDKATLVYNLNLEYFQERKATRLKNECKHLEYDNGKYCIVCPENSSELIEEGIALHHCVGSYVDRVNKGETSIIFLRKSKTPEESLITVEYKNGAIVQVRGSCERLMNDDEREFFNEWTKKFKLTVIGEW